MRFILALVFIFCGVLPAMSFAGTDASMASQASTEKVKWLTYKEGLAQGKALQRMIFVDLYADWCVPCRIMDANVYTDSSVVRLLNERFVPVKLDVDSQEKIVCDGKTKTAQKCFHEVWDLKALPSFVLLAPKGLSILTVTQSMSAEDMQTLLGKFLSKEKEWIAR